MEWGQLTVLPGSPSLSVCLSVGKGQGCWDNLWTSNSGYQARWRVPSLAEPPLTLFSWCVFGFFPPVLLFFYDCFVVCFWTLFFESFYMPWYSRNIGSRIPTDTRILSVLAPVGNKKKSIFISPVHSPINLLLIMIFLMWHWLGTEPGFSSIPASRISSPFFIIK